MPSRTARRTGVVVGVLAGGVLLSTALAPSASAEAEAPPSWERTTEPAPDPDVVPSPGPETSPSPDTPGLPTDPTNPATGSAPRP